MARCEYILSCQVNTKDGKMNKRKSGRNYAKKFWVAQRLMASETIGQFSRRTGMPYSSVRRYLEELVNEGYVGTQCIKYKSTGKNIFWLTSKGFKWISPYVR